MPVGAEDPGPIGPGGAYEVAFDAAPGDKLSFALMFVPSNDFFFGPDEAGIDLFEVDGTAVTGDVTDSVLLWDAGTEENEEPGSGPNQVQRQPQPNTGPPDPDARVREAEDVAGNLPATRDVLRATLASTSDTGFVLRIENVSGDCRGR